MQENPDEMLERGKDALCGINDLLVSVGRGDLHMVNPGNLYCLIELVCRELDQAARSLERDRKSA